MRKSNEIEVYLLDHWEDIANLQEEVQKFKSRIAKTIPEIIDSLKEKEWWRSGNFSEQIYPEVGEPRAIHIFNKQWQYGNKKWHSVYLYVENITLNNMLGDTEELPTAGIWTGEGLKDEKKNLLMSKLSTIVKELKTNWHYDENRGLVFYYPHKAGEWIQIIKDGQLVEEIVKIFDNLAQFIDPIDKAIAEVLRMRKGKK
ncbi:MAG: hypothetical protein ABIL39_04165 [candidate division WOR-3 bacterium]